MASDNFIPGLATGAILASANTVDPYELKRQNLEQRANIINDTLGARPPSFEEYSKREDKGTHWGKVLFAAAVGAAVVVGIAAAAAGVAVVAGTAPGLIASLAPQVGGWLAAIGGVFGAGNSMSRQYREAVNDYEGYLGDFAKNARAAQQEQQREQTIAAVQEAEQGTSKQWGKGELDRRHNQQTQTKALS